MPTHCHGRHHLLFTDHEGLPLESGLTLRWGPRGSDPPWPAVDFAGPAELSAVLPGCRDVRGPPSASGISSTISSKALLSHCKAHGSNVQSWSLFLFVFASFPFLGHYGSQDAAAKKEGAEWWMAHCPVPSTWASPAERPMPEDIYRAGALAPCERECARMFGVRAALALRAGKCKVALEIRKRVCFQSIVT